MRVIGSNLEHLAVEKLWRICFSPSRERVNARWQSTVERCSSRSEHSGHVHSKLVLAFHTAEASRVGVQAEPHVLDVY